MTYARFSQRTNLRMRPVNSWVSEHELEQIKKVKGDVSISLWIRRQIRKALLEGRATNQDPQPATVVPNANPQDTTPKEIEA
jgi:hypothetical protein